MNDVLGNCLTVSGVSYYLFMFRFFFRRLGKSESLALNFAGSLSFFWEGERNTRGEKIKEQELRDINISARHCWSWRSPAWIICLDGYTTSTMYTNKLVRFESLRYRTDRISRARRSKIIVQAAIQAKPAMWKVIWTPDGKLKEKQKERKNSQGLKIQKRKAVQWKISKIYILGPNLLLIWFIVFTLRGDTRY